MWGGGAVCILKEQDALNSKITYKLCNIEEEGKTEDDIYGCGEGGAVCILKEEDAQNSRI